MKKTGFTLIESMVALSIIMIAITIPLYNASRGLTAAQGSSYQITGSYLAQEGVEYVRKMRDDAYLASLAAGGATISDTGWNNFLSGSIASCISPKLCTLDPWPVGTLTPISPCFDGVAGNNTCVSQPLNLIPGGGYTQATDAGNTPTLFYRTVQVKAVNAKEETVTSLVTWTFHGQAYNVTIIDHLTAWQ